MYQKRWQSEVKRQLEDQNSGIPMDFGVEQLYEDWKKTVALASTAKSTNNHRFYSLEEIHIFALANILRRPILVICDDSHRGAGVNLGGIYLPLLSNLVDCIKTPLIIGYHHGHFTALVMAENNERGHTLADHKMVIGVPLMKHNGQPMKLRCLLPEERNYSGRLQREYLNYLKLHYTFDNECEMKILVAEMEACEQNPHVYGMLKRYFKSMEDIHLETLTLNQLSLNDQRTITSYSTKHEDHFKNSKEQKPCAKINCRNIASINSNYCHQCRNTDNTRICTSPGCDYTANPDYEALCSTCFTTLKSILHEGTKTATPSASPNDRCYNNCVNKGNDDFRGLCYDCYREKFLNYRSSAKKDVGQSRSVVQCNRTRKTTNMGRKDGKKFQVCDFNDQRTMASYSTKYEDHFKNSKEHKPCAKINCRNIASAESNYCHQCRNTDNTRICTSTGCGYTANPDYEGLCSTCFTKLHALLEEGPHMVTPSAPPNDRCYNNCVNKANVNLHGLCYDCYKEKFLNCRSSGKKDIGQSTFNVQGNTTRKTTNSGRKDEKKFHVVNASSSTRSVNVVSHPNCAKISPISRKVETVERRCLTKKCVFFGTPENENLCSQCYAKTLKLKSEKKTQDRKKTR
ncbi:tumor necrosis factor alpha-induced protein 3-like [Xenia sp. Carnegie-2017]|uniref:tumor necrosis factor alpha-induced protein 3-like n=1 Tax=Xenia sp. Carnegie-2017 TaxID=2897299 RepID=UPI001F043872|nr:tumor necrosis factor alpha-induced protein 3-like [Xenia sp. Carnegie-2017]